MVTLGGAALVVQWPRRTRAEVMPDAAEGTAEPPVANGGTRGRYRLRPWRRRREEQARARELFAVLEVQMRLGTLSAILRRIDSDPQMFARQHHWRTTLWAYDSVLADACRMASLPVHAAPAGPKADAERLRRELELYERGWTW